MLGSPWDGLSWSSVYYRLQYQEFEVKSVYGYPIGMIVVGFFDYFDIYLFGQVLFPENAHLKIVFEFSAGVIDAG